MNIIRDLRKKNGIKQYELAKILNVAQPTVCDWEANKKDPSGKNLKKLAEYFNTDELVILGRGSQLGFNFSEGEPKTIEAKILAQGIDKLSREQREKALNIVRAVFAEYPELFNGGSNDENNT